MWQLRKHHKPPLIPELEPYPCGVKQTIALLILIALVPEGVLGQDQIGDWQDVQNLPEGTSVSVRTSSAKLKCELTSVTAEILACSSEIHRARRISKFNFQVARSEIREVRRIHSAAEQSQIGCTGGVIAGVIVGTVGGIAQGPPRALRVMFAAPLLGVIGCGIGGLTHPQGSTIVYRRPNISRKQQAVPGRSSDIRSDRVSVQNGP